MSAVVEPRDARRPELGGQLLEMWVDVTNAGDDRDELILIFRL